MSTNFKAIFRICCARNGAKKQTVIFSSGNFFSFLHFFRLAIFPDIDFSVHAFFVLSIQEFVSVFFVPYLLSCAAYHYANIRRLDLHRVNSGRVQLLSARS